MIRTEVNTQQRYQPIPIAALIQTANIFTCDIFIKNGTSRINVKCYDDLKKGLPTRDKLLFFYFDGVDETKAEAHIEKLFQP